ncbi:MAG: choice-of-anchor D domain-containing protein [Ignavibacteriae bacterium]|nr:choice-of-anchor D domain-containing protein [Ignavibacteriota bacterium]
MKKLIFIFALVLLNLSSMLAQNASNYSYMDSVVVTQGTERSRALWALHPLATDGFDDIAAFELEGPPAPPAGLYVRFPIAGRPTGLIPDVRGYTSFPYSGSTTLTLELVGLTTPNQLSVNLPTGISIQIKDKLTGTIYNQTLTGNASVALNSALTSYDFVITFTNFTPPAPPSNFSSSPASLNFNGVAVGNTSDLSLTVNNTSPTQALDITQINLPAGYSINPTTANIAASGSQAFTVTFAPTAAQTYSGNIEFISSSTDLVAVTGFGQVPGATFSANPSSLSFGSVAVGSFSNVNITITNQGASNPMIMSNVTSDNPSFTVTGNVTATIAPGASEVYTVRFSPTAGGNSNANISFVSDATSSPNVITASGSGFVGSRGVFYFHGYNAANELKVDTVVRVDKRSFTDSLGLKYEGTEGLHALELKLVTNGKIILDEVRLGNAIPVAQLGNWNFLTNIVRGNLSSDMLTTVDEINILLYGNGTTTLLAGDYKDLFVFDYYVADINQPDTQRTSIELIEVYASEVDATQITTVPSADTLTQIIEIRNGSTHGSKGDVNNDGTINLLDLLDVVDHILEVKLMAGSKFERADIAPWSSNGDGIVNVQDLALIQKIILDGEFPDGTPSRGNLSVKSFEIVAESNTLSKSNYNADARITVYVTENELSAVIENKIAVKGVQLNYNNILNLVSKNLDLSTELGKVYYQQVAQKLRVLIYDNSNSKILEPGKHSLVSIPLEVVNPENVKLESFIVANTENQEIEDVEIVYAFESAPILPTEYALEQNYPNPFNPSTKIEFSVPETNNVSLIIYNVLGQEVKTLFLGEVDRGRVVLNWDGTNNNGSFVNSGIYIVRMNAGKGDFNAVRKMMMLK